MEQDSYEYQEYPKWVKPENSEPVIVRDADEEAKVMNVPKRRGRPPKE